MWSSQSCLADSKTDMRMAAAVNGLGLGRFVRAISHQPSTARLVRCPDSRYFEIQDESSQLIADQARNTIEGTSSSHIR